MHVVDVFDALSATDPRHSWSVFLVWPEASAVKSGLAENRKDETKILYKNLGLTTREKARDS